MATQSQQQRVVQRQVHHQEQASSRPIPGKKQLQPLTEVSKMDALPETRAEQLKEERLTQEKSTKQITSPEIAVKPQSWRRDIERKRAEAKSAREAKEAEARLQKEKAEAAAAVATQDPASSQQNAAKHKAYIDQRGQHVVNQWNAAGDIFYAPVYHYHTHKQLSQNPTEIQSVQALRGELREIRAQLGQMTKQQVIAPNIAQHIEIQLTKTIHQTQNVSTNELAQGIEACRKTIAIEIERQLSHLSREMANLVSETRYSPVDLAPLANLATPLLEAIDAFAQESDSQPARTVAQSLKKTIDEMGSHYPLTEIAVAKEPEYNKRILWLGRFILGITAILGLWADLNLLGTIAVKIFGL